MEKEWDEFLKNLSELNKMYKEATRPIAEMQIKVSNNINNALKPVSKQVVKIKEVLRELASMLIIPELFAEYSELAKEGWYISSDYFEFINGSDEIILQSSDKGFEINYSELILRINKYFPLYVEEIHSKVIKANPKRKLIFNELFSLYEKKMYYSLIPLALAQVDGLCKEKYSISFFEPEKYSHNEETKYRQKLMSVIEEGEDLENLTIVFLLFSQIDFDDKNDLPLLEYNTKNMSQLNRHSIMHGESCDYGSKENAIKALLLLDFVLELVKSFRKK